MFIASKTGVRQLLLHSALESALLHAPLMAAHLLQIKGLIQEDYPPCILIVQLFSAPRSFTARLSDNPSPAVDTLVGDSIDNDGEIYYHLFIWICNIK